MRRTLRVVFLFFVCGLMVVSPVFGLSDAREEEFAQNNLLFYDPEGADSQKFCASSFADCNIIGETKDEKLWSGLRHVGFDPEQTAAIMGNMAHEGGTPTRQEGAYNIARNRNCLTKEGEPYTIWRDQTDGLHHGKCMQDIYSGYADGKAFVGIGLGFVQWTSHKRRLGYLEEMRKLNLLQYFDGDAYKTWGSITDDNVLYEKIMAETGSDADYWALWCAAIHFVRTEMDGDYKEFHSKSGVREIAGWVSAKYEVCSGCQAGQSSYNARVASAEQYYQDYLAGRFDAVESGDASSGTVAGDETGTNVTVIGDSIAVGAKADILGVLPDADVTNVQDSKSFATGSNANKAGTVIAQELKDAGTLRKKVVFALGTNDKGGIGEATIKNLVEEILGPSYSIYFVTNYDDHDPSIYATNNAQLTAAAAVYNNAHLIDWKSIVETAKRNNPGTAYIKDEWATANYSVHPTAEGNALFAKAIFDGVNGVFGRNDRCENISDPSQAISYLQQFIVDTNYLYDQKYVVPQNVQIDVNTGTPGSDWTVTANPAVRQEWLSKGLIKESDLLGGCWRATHCGQCTALSGWFVTMMTDYTYNGGDGRQVVGKMMEANPDMRISDTPIAFSIFSDNGSGTAAGHTGVVLGVMDDGSYLTIENNMGNHDLKIKKRTDFEAKRATFFDVSDKLKLGHLGTTYE